LCSEHYCRQTLQEVGVQTSCLAGSYNIHGDIAQVSDSYIQFFHHLCVVATTRRNGTRSMLTSAKLSNGLSSKEWGITRELDKELSLHCSSIYTITLWSMLQQYVYLMSIHHAFTSCPITHLHVFSLRPPCFLHVP